MKIMITGGNGFIGSHLVDSLFTKNHNLCIISRNNFSNILKYKKNIQFEKIDVSNFSKLENIIKNFNPDEIIHLAGNTSHSVSFEKPFFDLNSNLKSTLNILEIIKKNKLNSRLILGSTFVVVGKPSKIPVDENSICNPTTIYGINKFTSEMYCKIYNKIHNVNSTIFRITNSFGPREQIIPNKNAINYLIYRAYKGEKITLYNEGKIFRDLIYVSDVVNGIEKIITNGKSNEMYWISSFKKTWLYELGKLLEKHTDAKVEFIESPSYTNKVDVGNFIADNNKLKKLGWKQNVSVELGIKKTLEYFKK